MAAAGPRSSPITLMLVDQVPIFRAALRYALEAQGDFSVVGEASGGIEAVEIVHSLRPDLVLMDLDLPTMSGAEVAQLIREQLPEVKVVVLTALADDDHLFSAVEAEVNGYLLKDTSLEQLYAMLRSAVRDETPISPALVGRLLSQLRHEGLRTSPHGTVLGSEALSHRELEVMRLVAEGLTNREIGRALSITEGTVKNHVHNALQKLKMHNRIQAAAYVVRHGLGLSRSH